MSAAQDVLFSSSPIKLHRLVGWSDGSASSSDVAGMQVRACGMQRCRVTGFWLLNLARFRKLFLYFCAPCTSFPRRGPRRPWGSAPARSLPPVRPFCSVLSVYCLSRAFEGGHVRIEAIRGHDCTAVCKWCKPHRFQTNPRFLRLFCRSFLQWHRQVELSSSFLVFLGGDFVVSAFFWLIFVPSRTFACCRHVAVLCYCHVWYSSRWHVRWQLRSRTENSWRRSCTV